MPFKPGQSGNPSGRRRPPNPELKMMAQSFTREAIECAVKILRKPKARDSDKLKAVEILLERGHGKPVQHEELTANVSIEVSVRERQERARMLIDAAFGEDYLLIEDAPPERAH